MNLFFLNPFFLIGIIAVSLPIISHLISRKSGVKKSFSAVSFLISSEVEAVKRSKIKDIILLVIRSLILVILVLVFSKPSLLSFSPLIADDPKTVAIVIDNSFSMGYGDNFENAKKEAKSLIESLPDGSFGTVLPLVPIDVKKLTSTNDKRKMLEDLKNLKLSFSFTANERRLEDIFGFIEKAPNDEKGVFLFTDFQRNGWINEGFKREWLIPIDVTSGAQMQNRAVSDIEVKDGDDIVEISVKVSNYSDREENDLLATLLLDNREIKGFFKISPTDEQIKDFIVPEDETNLNETIGKVEIPNDNLPADDIRYLVHSKKYEPRILLVDGDPREDARLSETYYLSRSIETISQIFPIKLSIIDNDSFLTDELRLQDYNLIFLANAGDITTKKANEIKEFLRNGGGVVIFLGDRVRSDLYNVMLGSILPAEIGTILQGDYFLIAYELNKLIEGMNEKFKEVEVKRVFQLHTIKNTDIILSTSYNTPYLTQGKVEKGDIFLFASTADSAWNNFPITPVFLPTINRILDFYPLKQNKIEDLLVGESIKIDFPDELEEVKVRTPLGKEIKLYKGNPNFNDTHIPGIYSVKKGEEILYNFSVNVDTRESNLEKIFLESASQRSGAETGLAKVFKEIWIYFLWGAIALFISESVVRFLYAK